MEASNVSGIMTKGLITISMDATLLEAKEIMENENIRHLPVVDDDNKLAGFITERDILMNISPRLGTISEKKEDRDTLGKKVHRVMTRNPITVTLDSDVADAAKILASKKISGIPVVDDKGVLMGIVTVIDILKYVAERG
ncbi:MAG: CBS domain-containing protein [Deltaproteobacteria bacterium]|nr:CBS domain-containing protein [Deltaproteobacteria bacterium]